MDSNNAARLAPGRSRFPSETWRVSNEFLRKIDSCENFVAMKICHWHFRCRREKELTFLKSVHVGLELRQLRGADHAIPPHQKRRTDLGIAILARMQIEHELDQRSLQPRAG